MRGRWWWWWWWGEKEGGERRREERRSRRGEGKMVSDGEEREERKGREGGRREGEREGRFAEFKVKGRVVMGRRERRGGGKGREGER